MSTDARFAAGDWYAVVGDAATLVLPPTQRARVAGLWELADGGAGADELLDALLGGGLSTLDHFVLLAHDEASTRLIVRGGPTATVTTAAGEQQVAAEPGTAWAERVLAGVTGVRVILAGDAAADLPLTAGLARVSALEVGAVAAAGRPQAPVAAVAAPEPGPEPEPAPEPEPTPAPTPTPTPEPEPQQAAAPAAPAQPEPGPVSPHAVEATPPGYVPWGVPEPAPAPAEAEAEVAEAAAPAQPEVATPPAEPSAADLFSSAPPPYADDPGPPTGLTFGEPEDDPTPTGETPVVEADDWDRDGQTHAGAPVPDFSRPPIPGQEMAPDVVSHPVAALVFSTGEVIEVDRAVLIGRAPEARRFASHDQPHVVTVPSPHQEISSTHLEIRPGAGADHGSAIATDLGSTNGTVLAQPGLDSEELKPGIAVSLIPGAVLDLGDGVTIQVTNP